MTTEAQPTATSTATAATPATETVITQNTGGDAPNQALANTKADFPDDWREKLSGDNTKMLDQLKRYASPKAWTESAFALRQKLSAGELKSALAKDATPEQVAEWRKDNGIPETPDKYELKDLTIPETDKPIVDKIIAKMHAANATPEQVKAAVGSYYEQLNDMVEARQEADLKMKETAEDALRAEWGGEFKANMNGVRGILDLLGPEFNDLSLSSRAPDGSLWQDNPVVIRALAGLAKIANPLGVITPNESGDRMATLESEIKAIEAKMGTKAYTPEDRARAAELYDIRDKSKGRAA